MSTALHYARSTDPPVALADKLLASGWVTSSVRDASNAETEVFEIAQSLGSLMPGRNGNAVEYLAPTPESSSEPKSLSALYGQQAFPLHTDGAHLVLPPRFIILACINPGSAPVPTILMRFDEFGFSREVRERISAGNFLVRTGGRFTQACTGPTVRLSGLIRVAWYRSTTTAVMR